MRALVTGAAGFLGGRLAKAALARNWTVSGSFHQNDALPAGIEKIQMDLTRSDTIQRAVAQTQPEVIFHAAAMAKPDDCAQNPKRCQKVNVEGSQALAAAAHKHGAKLIFISSDLVFDGTQAPYSETALPRPLGVYGRSKLDAEEACLAETQADACLARCVLMYGTSASDGQSFLWGLIQNLKKGKALEVFSDQIRCPIEVGDLCEALLRCAEKKIKGVIHLAGPESVSRLTFALTVAKIFQLDPTLIHPALHAKTVFDDPRPLDVSLSIKPMRGQLQMNPSNPDTGLQRVRAQFDLL